MNTAELKNHILKLVVETDDSSVLEKVKDYFTSLTKSSQTKSSKKTTVEDELSEKQKEHIRLSEEDIKNGDVLSHKEVQEMAKKILAKK